MYTTAGAELTIQTDMYRKIIFVTLSPSHNALSSCKALRGATKAQYGRQTQPVRENV